MQEGASQLEACMILQGGMLARPVYLTISSSNGTAQAPGDYNELIYHMTLSHSDGVRKCINITIIDDELVEDTEIFSLTLASEDNAVSLIPDRLTVMILDNDKVTLTLQQTNYTVNESVGQLELNVELKGTLERNITVSLETTDGNASSRSGDYTAILETLTFSSGSESGSTVAFAVDIHDDQIVEGEESFSIQATSSDAAVVFEAEKETAYVSIEDDDCK